MARVNPLFLLPLAVSVGLGVMAWQTLSHRQTAADEGQDPNALPSMLEGHEAGPVNVVALGDLPAFTAADLKDGKVKIVNFWASWCAPCRVEHPNLKKLSDEGVRILGVNYKDKPENARGFLAELGNPYAAIGADSGRLGIEWGVYGVPETFVIDAKGHVILRHAGPITEQELERVIRPAIAKARGE